MSHLDHREKGVLNKNAPGQYRWPMYIHFYCSLPFLLPSKYIALCGFYEHCNATLNTEGKLLDYLSFSRRTLPLLFVTL
jgi:hypothetical protein